MNCPSCQHQMISAKPGYMCLNCGHLVAKKAIKSSQKTTTANPKAKAVHQAVGNKPTAKSSSGKSAISKAKAAKAMDIKVRVK